MDLEQKDKAVISVILKRFEHERYPRMKALKEKVDDGDVLDPRDLMYLEQVLGDVHQLLDVITRHPEYGALVKAGLLMYEEIMTKSQLNSNSAK
jgi:hypothetical protein